MLRIDLKKASQRTKALLIALYIFASTCFWEPTKLKLYMGIGVGVIIACMLMAFLQKVSINQMVNDKAVQWLLANFTLVEIYGLLFLRTGTFNWDLILFSGLSLIAIVINVISEPSAEDMIYVYCLGCKMAAIFTIVYIYTNDMLNISSVEFGFRFGDGLSGNVNTVGTSLVTMFVPVFYWFLRKKKLSDLVICGTLGICMLLTGSKKTLFAVFVAVLLYMAVNQKPTKYLVILAGAGIGGWAIFNIPTFYQTIGFRIVDMLATLGIGEAETAASSTELRSSYIRMGLKSFLNVPLFGGGMNYFMYETGTVHYSHNNYVELLNTYGIFGFLVFYYKPVAAMLKYLRDRRHAKAHQETENSNNLLFCASLIILKLLLDIGMVSFTALGIFFLSFVIPLCMLKYNMENE